MEAVIHARYLCVTNRGKGLPRFFEKFGAKVLHAMLFTGAIMDIGPAPYTDATHK